jgi:hypothetical protein
MRKEASGSGDATPDGHMAQPLLAGSSTGTVSGKNGKYICRFAVLTTTMTVNLEYDIVVF